MFLPVNNFFLTAVNHWPLVRVAEVATKALNDITSSWIMVTAFWALIAFGRCGEAGKVAEQVKKHFFHGHELDKRHMIEELGDVAWYLAVLCDAIGSDLDTVMEENLKKLEQRYPEGFDPYRSQHRNELGG